MNEGSTHWENCYLEHQVCAWAEIDRLRTKLAECERDAGRYRTIRKMPAAAYATALQVNIKTGKPFDEIIDDLKPFYFGDAQEDRCR